ncbi:MAG TPA: toll/interleukin-1 receptor domain-containing protein [Pyrinomonadaceae bacterium]|jgi:hypothetical protein|nr:toll/interleukin-1 receptor domain-containing protein [Pyrinomonadaceae bacterium]
MNILLYEDATVHANLEAVALGLSATGGPTLNVREGDAKFAVASFPLRYGATHRRLPPAFSAEAERADLSLCFTCVPYDNNHFYEKDVKSPVVVSLYAWDQLTKLPVENLIVYFVASVLRFRLPLPPHHRVVTGCINDYLWNKTGIDLGMRSGFICPACKGHLGAQESGPGAAELLGAVERILRDLAAASSNNESILDYWGAFDAPAAGAPVPPQPERPADKFDVFLCHNVKDKAEVRLIARELKARGIRTWLDEEQLRPGTAWHLALEEQISAIDSVAVFLGGSGVGPWQSIEIYSFLSEFANRRCPVIPVILPDAETVPELPLFLRQMQCVDFRESPGDAIELLVWGITGKKPVRSAVK